MTLARFARALAVLVPAALVAGPAPAADVDLALLQSFAGRYAGAGTLTGKDGTSTFDCALTTSVGNRGKLVLKGTCAPLSVAGAMGFDAAAGRFEMLLTSNANFTGKAYGLRDEEDLHFSLKDSDVNEENRSLTLSAEMAMRGDVILISFDAVLDGETYAGKLTFTK